MPRFLLKQFQWSKVFDIVSVSSVSFLFLPICWFSTLSLPQCGGRLPRVWGSTFLFNWLPLITHSSPIPLLFSHRYFHVYWSFELHNRVSTLLGSCYITLSVHSHPQPVLLLTHESACILSITLSLVKSETVFLPLFFHYKVAEV